MTPEIKAKLRRKNKLMHAGKIEEANALATRIGSDIIRHNSAQFRSVDVNVDAKDMWLKVKQLSSRGGKSEAKCDVTADQLNKHYAAISQDHRYLPPVRKLDDNNNTPALHE